MNAYHLPERLPADMQLSLAIEYLSAIYDVDLKDKSSIDHYVDNLHLMLTRVLKQIQKDNIDD